MPRNSKDATFDFDMRLKDAGLVAASAAAQIGGAARVIDIGAGRVDARVIVDISAVEVATGDEKYVIIVQGSSSATFATDVWNFASVPLGDSTTSLETVDTLAGRRQEIAFCNEVNGTTYRYVRLYTQVVGTIATGINYVAHMVQGA